MFERAKNDVKLLEDSRNGSAEAFATLVGRYQSLVCAITYSGTGSLDKSEELAQEAFLRAWKSLGQLQDLAKFRAWLCRIARSTVQNWYRSRRRDVAGRATPLDSVVDRPSGESGPDEAAMAKEQQIVVSQALAGIPEALRVPLVLFYREEKSIRDVAGQLGLSEAAARQRISRGRSMLRDQVAQMVETTLTHSRPDKAFTAAVAASIAALAVKGSTAAAAAGTAEAVMATGGSLGLSGILAGTTGKIAAMIAVAAVVAGGIVGYRRIAGSAEPPDLSTNIQTVPAAQEMPTGPALAIADPDVRAETAADANGGREDIMAVAPPANDPTEPSSSEEKMQQQSVGAVEGRAFEFKAKGVLSGLITDAETGDPVRDAVVQISNRRTSETRTDTNGYYSFPRVREAGNFTVAIGSLEYVGISPGEQNPILRLDPEIQAVRHFQLDRACMLDVWVVDANGVGIEGATVVPTSLASTRYRPVDYLGESVTTDPNGYILLGGFRPAETEYLITVLHKTEEKREERGGLLVVHTKDDYAPNRTVVRLTDPNVIKQVQVVLERGQTVYGCAEYADGVPAMDIEINATPDWWHSNRMTAMYPVNSDGTFALEHIVPGTYDIKMLIRDEAGGGVLRSVMQAELPPPEAEPLIVRLREKSPQSLVAIRGRLVFPGEKKPANVHIAAYSQAGGSARASVGLGPDGTLNDMFVVDRLEPGTYTLDFSGSEIADKRVEGVTAPCDDVVVELDPASQSRFVGRVLDAQTGEPIPEFRIRARKLRTLGGLNRVQPDGWLGLKDSQGRFEIDVVGPGVYQIQASAPGHAPAWTEEVNPADAHPITVALSAGGGIRGRVVNGEGDPVYGASVVPLSLAGGTMPRTKDVFVSEEGAVQTDDGVFALNGLPAGVETLKVTHPDHAFTIVKGIQVAEGQTTDGVEIILPEGATVEGYVYDDAGAPASHETLSFQDASGYGGTADEDAGRLGVAVTDSNGFYRIEHLPEQLCYVTRAEGTDLGVVRQTILPRNGRLIRLDFGGMPIVSGIATVDGDPLTKTRLLLGPTSSPHFGHFRCNTVTDEHGAFAFGGAAPGTHAIYYEGPGKRGDWIRIATVSVAETNVNLGVIGGKVPELSVTFHGSATGPKWGIQQLFLGQDSQGWPSPLALAKSPVSEGGPWVVKNVEPGRYALVVVRDDLVQWRRAIELAPGANPWEVSIDLPKWETRLSGRILGEGKRGLVFWREQKDIQGNIVSGQDGRYSVGQLPPGRYFAGDWASFRHGLPPIAAFDLREGQEKTFDFDLTDVPLRVTAVLTVRVVDENGRIRRDAQAHLDGPLGVIEPIHSMLDEHIFVTTPGEHTLDVELPGYRRMRKEVNVAPFEPGSTPKVMVVYLER